MVKWATVAIISERICWKGLGYVHNSLILMLFGLLRRVTNKPLNFITNISEKVGQIYLRCNDIYSYAYLGLIIKLNGILIGCMSILGNILSVDPLTCVSHERV